MTYELTPYEHDLVAACELATIESPQLVSEYARGRATIWGLVYEVVKTLGLRCKAYDLSIIQIVLQANIQMSVKPEDCAYPMEHIAGPLKAMLEVVEEYPAQVKMMQEGKTALSFLVGQVMKKTKGQANHQVVQTMLRDHILGQVH